METNTVLVNQSSWRDKSLYYIDDLRETFEDVQSKRGCLFGDDKLTEELDRLQRIIPPIAEEGNLVLIKSCKEALRDIGHKIMTLAQEHNVMGKKKKKHRRHQQNNSGHIKANSSEHKSSEKKEPLIATTSTPTMNDLQAGPNYVLAKDTESKIRKIEFEVVMSRKAYNKIKTWCKLLDDEITALGIVKQRSNVEFFIEDFFLFRQVVSKTQCEMKDTMSIVELMEKINNDPELRAKGYNSSSLKCWWHSHNTMGTGPSGTDETTSKNFATNTFLITLISNHRDEFYSRITIYKPIELVFEDIPVYIEDPGISDEFINERKEEIRRFVEGRTYSSYKPATGFHPNYTSRYHYSDQRPIGFDDPVYYHYDDDDLSNDEKVKAARDNTVIPLPSSMLDEKELTDEEIKASLEKNEGPYGNVFTENTIKYEWDYKLKKYRCYDGMNNVELTDEELDNLGVINYNRELGLGDYMSPLDREGA